MEFWDVVGWMLANIVAPFALPIVIIRSVQRFPHVPQSLSAKPMLTETLKDGQLGLTCLAIVAVAEYELWPALGSGVSIKICFWALLLMGGVSLTYVVLGAAFPAPLGQHPMSIRQWLTAYPVGRKTVYLSVLVSLVFAAAHFIIKYEEVDGISTAKAAVKPVGDGNELSAHAKR
jgi:membrane protease YdiL (CAAX protease family)